MLLSWVTSWGCKTSLCIILESEEYGSATAAGCCQSMEELALRRFWDQNTIYITTFSFAAVNELSD